MKLVPRGSDLDWSLASLQISWMPWTEAVSWRRLPHLEQSDGALTSRADYPVTWEGFYSLRDMEIATELEAAVGEASS